MEKSAREMEINGPNPKLCANFDIDTGISPVVAADQCVVQLVSIPRKIFDQLQEDTAPIRDIVQEIQMSTGAVIKAVERETTRLPSGRHFGQQKARKEYYFQITGSAAQVERAKDGIERIFKNCHVDERVSLKMDVSFSDHSFIIGRYGRGIQNVSHETNCLIHFPDSNKNKAYEKSNQVSISGPPEGVLEARRRIRKLLPISFAFVIAGHHHERAMWQVGPQMFETRPRVQEMINILQNEHRITITMLPMHSLQSSAALVTVRGRHANIERIKDGILKLMAFLAPDNGHLSVYVGIEVSPHHLDFVSGPSGVKLLELMRETNTTIEIPEIPGQRQSIPTVRIMGQVLNVYQAWVKFMDLLPLALLVEIPSDTCPLQELPVLSSDNAWSIGEEAPLALSEDSSFAAPPCGASRIDDIAHDLNGHLEAYDITLISRQKSREIRDTTRQWWLVIKGPEKYVDIMFEIHKALSKDDPVSHVLSYLQEIPEPTRYNYRLNRQPMSRLGVPPSSPNVDQCFRQATGGLAIAWDMLNAPRTPAVRPRPLTSTWPQEARTCVARNATQASSGPSLSLSDSEGLEIFALLLKIGLLPPQDMTRSTDSIGNYYIPLNDDESPSSMTSTPIKLTRPSNSQADANPYWKSQADELPSSFLLGLEEAMDCLRLEANRSSTAGCGERDSFMSGSANNNEYSTFRTPPTRALPTPGASNASTEDQACCSGLSRHSLFDDDIIRDCLSEMPLTSNAMGDLGSCASSDASLEPSGFGTVHFGPAPDNIFGNSKRMVYKEHSRNSLLSGYGTDSDYASRSTKSLDLDSASPMNSNLANSDSGFSALKEGLGDLDFDSMIFKTGDRASHLNRYNLWGQEIRQAKSFDAAPGSGRETHS